MTSESCDGERKPAEYTLHLRFDVAQVTKSLQYVFTGPDGKSPQQTMGDLAGTFNFIENDTLKVIVTATGIDTANQPVGDGTATKGMHFAYPPNFSVTNCSLVSVGTLGHAETPDLSLFDEHDAITSVNKWGVLQQEDEPTQSGETRAAFIPSLETLRVTAKNGQWAISGYLSVLIQTTSGAGWPRLFYFDPEGSAGNGGGMGGG